jgi:hypothetical protein
MMKNSDFHLMWLERVKNLLPNFPATIKDTQETNPFVWGVFAGLWGELTERFSVGNCPQARPITANIVKNHDLGSWIIGSTRWENGPHRRAVVRTNVDAQISLKANVLVPESRPGSELICIRFRMSCFVPTFLQLEIFWSDPSRN